MDLFIKMFKKECERIHKENIRIVVSGRKEMLRKDVQEAIKYIEEKTKNNTRATFNVCMAYGGRQEIVDATKKILADDGYEIIDQDLNEDAGSFLNSLGDQAVYMGIKRTADEKKAIRDMKTMNMLGRYSYTEGTGRDTCR